MKKLMKKLIAMAAALVMIVTLLPAMGVKAAAFGSQTTGTITIIKNGDTDKEYLAGAVFSFYRLASISQDSTTNVWKYTVADKFKTVLGDGGNLNDLKSQEWESKIDNLAPLANDADYTSYPTVADTGSTGATTVGMGIYLVKETTTPSGYVASKPFIVSVPSSNNYSSNKPGQDGTQGTGWTYDIIAQPKNSSLPITKQTTDTDKTAGIDDVVPYTINTQIPNYGTEYTNPKFVVYDKMSAGLDLNEDSITVNVEGVQGAINEGQDTYTITYDVPDETETDRTFEITFTESFIKNHIGKDVTITYNATVTKDAVYIIGNKAGVDYHNAPGQDANKETEEENVYTFGINLTKKDANNGKGLNNAEFTLQDDSDNTIKFTVNNGNAVVTEGASMTTATVDSVDGKLIIKGLAAGTYTLTEIKSPAGYTLLAQPITIVINANEDGTFANATVDGTQVTAGVTNGIVPVEVKNSKGFTLPSTGGMGTYLFTIGGIVIMAGAAFALIAMKKRA